MFVLGYKSALGQSCRLELNKVSYLTYIYVTEGMILCYRSKKLINNVFLHQVSDFGDERIALHT